MTDDTHNGLAATPTLTLTPTPEAAVVEPSVSHADPGSLGLAAFALTTFVLSFVNAGLLPVSVEPVVFGLALFYGGLAQFAAGIWELVNRNTFGATAFCSYGAFWMSFWYLTTQTDLSGASAEDAGKGVGVFLLAWAIFTAYMTVAARRTSLAVLLVFVFLTVTFVALALGDYADLLAATRIGGLLGIVTALLAWYASAAVVINATHQRTVLPVDR